MKEKGHVITLVRSGSLAEELELSKGDVLLEINGHKIEDIFDYQYFMEDTYVELLVRKQDGEEWLLEVEKDEDEDLGAEFENGLMDEYRSCRNKCVFCFIDQMPPGMRETLYFKDDDSRLSFLQGNYVTLTNMSDHDIDRIIAYHLGPINISIHTMDPELRCRMLHNRFAGEALEKMDRLRDAGIEMNGQIVLCRGINDRDSLEETIRALEPYLPCMKSVSVVPVGLTRFRDSLDPLLPLGKEDMEDTIDRIEQYQSYFLEQYGCHFIHASDEFYLMTGRAIPEEERYDGYPQLENGVGMVRLLEEEVRQTLEQSPKTDIGRRRVSIATGRLAAPVIKQLSDLVRETYSGLEVTVHAIENRFFGERITVSGLITGQDLEAQLKGRDLGEVLLLPENMLKSGEPVFLDDVTVGQLQSALQTKVDIVKSSGQEFVAALSGLPAEGTPGRYRPYELNDKESFDT